MIHDPAITSRYVCAGVHNDASFRPRVLHESVKGVGVDLLMVNSHGAYIADDEGLAFARVGFPAYGQVECQRRVVNGYGGGIDLVDRTCRYAKHECGYYYCLE